MALGAGGLIFVVWVIVEWQDKWKKTLRGSRWSFIRWGLQRCWLAHRNLGWVTVRYGIMGRGNQKNTELWSRPQKVWKGKATHLVFSEHPRYEPPFGVRNCFIEFSDSYKAVFLTDMNKHWLQETVSPVRGQRRYEGSVSVEATTILIMVGTDDQGKGGWDGAWRDIRHGVQEILGNPNAPTNRGKGNEEDVKLQRDSRLGA